MSEFLPEQVRDVRARQGLSQVGLAERVGELGGPNHASFVQKIEQAERRVTVDDLAVLAAALTVRPSALLVPFDPAIEVRVAPELVTTAGRVRRWVEGRYHLGTEDRPWKPRWWTGEVQHDVERANHWPVCVRIRGLAQALEDAAGANDVERVEELLDSAIAELERARNSLAEGLEDYEASEVGP